MVMRDRTKVASGYCTTCFMIIREPARVLGDVQKPEIIGTHTRTFLYPTEVPAACDS